ncbi:MAG: hypothetical protein Q9227_004062 [Pyrenula ochraceoflavens]
MAPGQGSENAPRLEVPPLTDDEATDVESQNGNLHVRSDSNVSDNDGTLPIPVWMRESAKSFRYKWIPVPIRQSWRSLAKWVLDPYYVGNRSLDYENVVIGGPKPDNPKAVPIYRADSLICQSAIHAGVISNDKGGCGVATLIGPQSEFPSSKHHGIKSTPFPASFPRSYTFEKLSESQATCPTDSRWPLFAATAVALVILSLFTTSPAAFFWSTFYILTLHVGLVSDPPNQPSMLELISTLFSRLLPASFVAFILYRYCAVPQLTGLTAQLEKTILYLGFAFIGALNNYTFAPLIPIQRLTPHDLKAQPGAPLALAIILVIIISVAIGQIHFLRISGLLPRYLRLYIAMVAALIILAIIPGLRLRIHHYILAILLMPGTALQTRPGLLYQGLLLGLFINGVTRWGFASVVQTPAALGEAGDGLGGSWWGATSPNVSAVVAPNTNHIRFFWGELPREKYGVDGVSILVNDVERWKGYVDNELYGNETGVTLPRGLGRANGEEWNRQEPEFFRFAWLRGSETGRYGKVGVWDETGKWNGMHW